MKFSEWVPQQNQTGWITPEGSILFCDPMEHLDVLEGTSLDEAYREYLREVELNEESMYSDLDSLPPGEHPAMHRFDGMNDDARDDLLETAYGLGWVRFGCGGIFSKQCWLEVYGSPERVSELRRDLVGLVKSTGWQARLFSVSKHPPRNNRWTPRFQYDVEEIDGQ